MRLQYWNSQFKRTRKKWSKSTLRYHPFVYLIRMKTITKPHDVVSTDRDTKNEC